MNFEEWRIAQGYTPNQRQEEAWIAATAAERESCIRICDDIYEEYYQKAIPLGPERGWDDRMVSLGAKKCRDALKMKLVAPLTFAEATPAAAERERIGRLLIERGYWTDEMSEDVLSAIREEAGDE